MKCNRKIFYYSKTSKPGKRRIFGYVGPNQNIRDTVQYWASNRQDFDRHYDTCDGDVMAEIKAIDEPYYGGASAELSVEFKCSKCKCTHYPELPDKYNINEWLNKVLREMK